MSNSKSSSKATFADFQTKAAEMRVKVEMADKHDCSLIDLIKIHDECKHVINAQWETWAEISPHDLPPAAGDCQVKIVGERR